MATSGSIDFSMTRNDIISSAFRKLGLYAEGEEPTNQQITDAALDLNMMVKHWKTDGINLWCYENITLFPVIGQESYTLGTAKATTSYNQTTVATAASSGASSIELTATTGAADTYNIGIELDGGSLQWTTISGALSGSTATLADTLTDDVAAGNRIYIYQTTANRPMRVLGARWEQSDGTETPLTESSRHDYENLANKDSQGNPTQFYYNPKRDDGVIYIWQTFDSVREVVHLTTQRSIEDFDLSTDNPDFPQEWYLPLVYNLAAIVADDYYIPEQKLNRIIAMADGLYDKVSGYDQEPASIQFVPV